MSAATAELNYIIPTQERPRSFTYEPADGSARTTVTTAPHQLAVQDLREEDHTFTLDGEGFAVVQHNSAVTDFQDEGQIRQVYYAEAERLLKEVTGAERVFIFDHTLRRRIPGQEDYRDGPRQPATRVHVDHTARSGPQRVRDLLPDEAEELLKGRGVRSTIRSTMLRLRWPRQRRCVLRNWCLRIWFIPTGLGRRTTWLSVPNTVGIM
jgi:hypothetical protein